MKLFFIKRKKLIKLILLTFIIFLMFDLGFFLLWTLIIFSYILLFRRNSVDFKNAYQMASDVIFSPVDGKVTEIIHDVEDEFHQVKGIRIRIILPWWKPYGLYMPITASLANIENYSGKSLWRYQANLKYTNGFDRTNLYFETKNKEVILMQVLKCKLGKTLHSWVLTGDRARLASCLGFLPFGGSIVMTIPGNSEILVKQSDTLKASQSILAGLKG